MGNQIHLFSIDGDLGGTVFAQRLHHDIDKSDISSQCVGVSVNLPNEGDTQIEFSSDITEDEMMSLNNIISKHKEHWLEEKKKIIYKEIDKEIEQRIRNGFEYPTNSNQRFSLSVNAQIKWAGLTVSKDMMEYPLRIPAIDDNSYYDIQDASTVVDMWQHAMNTVRQHISDGTITKENIKNSATIEEVNNIKTVYLDQSS